MKGLLRTIMALLTVLTLLAAALLGTLYLLTDGAFIRLTGTASLRAQQQERIDQAAEALTLRWGLTTDALKEYTADAATRYSDALADWWHALWNEPQADAELPLYMDDAQERALVQAIMADPGYQAVADPGQYRAIARDEIAYTLDEAVCDAVLPVRRSIANLALTTAADLLDLSLLRKAVLLGAGVLAATALALLLLAHRAAGCILVTEGLVMGLLTLPVWALDLCGMLRQLNPLAAEQGRNVLACLGILWYGAAAVLALTGLMLIAVKRGLRRWRTC